MFKKMRAVFWNAFDELNYFYVYKSKKGAMTMTLEEVVKIILVAFLLFIAVTGLIYVVYGKGGKVMAGIGKMFRTGTA